MEPIIGYKSAGDNNQYLVTLHIDPHPSNTNLERKGVAIKATAKFRCKKAFVAEIKNKNTGELTNKAASNYRSSFIYRQNEFIVEPDYDTDSESVCSEGIHFFLTEEVAFFWGRSDTIKNGLCKSWHENGHLNSECEYKNGKLEGFYRLRNNNGILLSESNYKNDLLEGSHKEWYNNGKLEVKCEYKNGVKEGLYREWFNNGTLEVECEYKNGAIEGLYKRWYINGKLWEKCEYKNGQREGPYKEWHDNGTLDEEGEYKNGVSYKKWHDNGKLWYNREERKPNYQNKISRTPILYNMSPVYNYWHLGYPVYNYGPFIYKPF